jgi:hypothetical protein
MIGNAKGEKLCVFLLEKRAIKQQVGDLQTRNEGIQEKTLQCAKLNILLLSAFVGLRICGGLLHPRKVLEIRSLSEALHECDAEPKITHFDDLWTTPIDRSVFSLAIIYELSSMRPLVLFGYSVANKSMHVARFFSSFLVSMIPRDKSTS